MSIKVVNHYYPSYDTVKSKQTLTYEELMTTKKPGIHKVVKPIKCYKKAGVLPKWQHNINILHKNRYKFRDVIVEMTIPVGATIIRPETNCESWAKLRASSAKIEKIYSIDDNMNINDFPYENPICFSRYSHGFIYEIGKTVKPLEPLNKFVECECGSGIHFFLTPEETQDYDFS
ncbi:hypothetical protein QLL95_gp1150 [Cotonvirus japonicus]|uniref:Uncharacterized protein n=1 Tax=Cotonvirus japonicus TaxID=2811091 RepID=A0ABM7NS37_9VIRU|nr:hypothetical protein QLL95_gp1150 [Cotonvirus japonicus]BCS82973.1 hypothetical protein [Cotonvirus japonicus]